MASRAKLVLLAVGILTVGFGIVDSQARRHSHRITVKHYVARTTLPPANDPSTGGVNGVNVTCPRGYKATGGGFDNTTITTVPTYHQFTNGYQVIGVNETNQTGTLSAFVACIKGRTAAARANAARPLQAKIRELRRQRAGQR